MNYNHNSRDTLHGIRQQGRRVRGMSLVEMMIALSIGTLLLAAVTQMVISVGRINFDSTAKLRINNDVRGFTNSLSRDARSARDFRVYAAINNLTLRGPGLTGDVLVLIWADPEPLEDATAGTEQEYFYDKVVIFARTVEDDALNIGPVMKYERNFAPPDAVNAGTRASETLISTLTASVIANADGLTTISRVIELTKGLADQRLFINGALGRSITINGEIFHGNEAKRVTNTYNYTITPRG